ncbi:5-(carboxyamino)imidazole ribonucleotide mutase [filamentous cyanobacterium CCP5]|nr:5-(carboxyamino)imidazole ribonucleotide mutase [filamentous cyanobacterium CCP5]
MNTFEVGIIMGSDSDLPTMQETIQICELFDVFFEVNIVSAHRTPAWMFQYAEEAYARGLKVIVAGAGGAAHLPGMVASLTPLPVIGVPIKSRAMNGLDSLYSIVQMPAGIPVATVAIGGGKNAGLLAVQILALHRPILMEKIQKYRQELTESVLEKNLALQKGEYRNRLD